MHARFSEDNRRSRPVAWAVNAGDSRHAHFVSILETRIRAADWTHPVSPLRALGRWSAVHARSGETIVPIRSVPT